ncbi:maltodextrin phosphorylase [Isosphaera pallida ATCC 43644]|uniref:Maltodextrin phosphorylase n=1 Tax=Isosphaera pallida (strain ATCC 43644 / DSM 9630 / IS1B) TaxID=575540 RepID=E8QYK2_ISOPI|nr:alpha-glucan family phosphorylase [Isosphaera pallida]ADV64185.1 maltodextrin phosphorylase [Isosphaera pallida ATCC 43644]
MSVKPFDPSTLFAKLRELSRNLWWTWQPGADQILELIDPELWAKVNHNAVEFLAKLPPDALERSTGLQALRARVDSGARRLAEYLHKEKAWGTIHAYNLRTQPVAYFSAEFGLHESLPIYSGGLGVLAGDHLKSASDLDIPLVGVGLLYNQGYFSQSLNAEGWQIETYANTDVTKLPVDPVPDPSGSSDQLQVSIDTPQGALHARVWKVEVGRRTLYLLDSDVPANRPEDRALTARLYGGDARVRIRQELLLGVGGLRALFVMGIRPSVIHLNEGHSAFAALEMGRIKMEEQGENFWSVFRDVAAMTVFTTHTPVAAGHDRFSPALVEETLGKYRESLHISHDALMSLGRVNTADHNEPFCMTVLALKMTRRCNGVSALHGEVSRRMWQALYPEKRLEEVPIGHITNGVHVGSWLASPMRMLYNRVLGPDWLTRLEQPEQLLPLEGIDPAELWEVHQILKARLIEFARKRLAAQAARRGEGAAAITQASRALDLETLTIGFARRFATYKRATLSISDADKLDQMINSTDQPIQIIFAGKAHPEDKYGKELIQSIVQRGRDPRFAGRIVFLEDYDMNVARHLVQGVDVWLNNPRRPQEASGTSGQKAAINGVLNCSILDGWWAEAYDGLNGFAIGRGQVHQDVRIQDQRDQADLLKTLTEEVVPLYYERDGDGLPRRWIARMKHAMATLCWRFSAERMVRDYTLRAYLPAAGRCLADLPSN